jgi:Capsular polysaccharide biosynthesis protein
MIGIFDIHCHVIPGVDDGAKTIDDSKKMLEIAYADGIRTIIVTPHFAREIFEHPIDMIDQKYQEVRKLAKEIGDDLKILLGCEYYAETDMVKVLKDEPRYTMANTRYVLIEFSDATEFSYIKAIINDLVINGYIPILAHVERCECLYRNGYAEELVALGAWLQVNADSVIGGNGRKAKNFCKKLMKENLLSFIGTDGHDTKMRRPEMKKCADYLEKKMGSDYAKKILISNPQKIIDEVGHK